MCGLFIHRRWCLCSEPIIGSFRVGEMFIVVDEKKRKQTTNKTFCSRPLIALCFILNKCQLTVLPVLLLYFVAWLVIMIRSDDCEDEPLAKYVWRSRWVFNLTCIALLAKGAHDDKRRSSVPSWHKIVACITCEKERGQLLTIASGLLRRSTVTIVPIGLLLFIKKGRNSLSARLRGLEWAPSARLRESLMANLKDHISVRMCLIIIKALF